VRSPNITVAGQDPAGTGVLCVVDMHAITVSYDPAELRSASGIRHPRRSRSPQGLDPEALRALRQGDVKEHTERTWLLTSVTVAGRAQAACTSYAKVGGTARAVQRRACGCYPVLQAARSDSLTGSDGVPVGEDQREQLEPHARRGQGASTRASARRSRTEPPQPRGGRADMDSRTRRADVDDGRNRRRGRSTSSTAHGWSEKKIQARRDRLRHRESARRRQAGRDQHVRDPRPPRAKLVAGGAARRSLEGARYGD